MAPPSDASDVPDDVTLPDSTETPAPIMEPMNTEGETYDVLKGTPDAGKVMKKVTKAGKGTFRPLPNREVRVRYEGRLVPSGEVFDSNSSFKFRVGADVIEGWGDAVKTMVEGEVATITLHPDKAYKYAGSPPKIPPNATLEFDIELLEICWNDISPSRDASIQINILEEPASEWRKPTDMATVSVHYTMETKEGKLIRNTRVDESPETFVVDDGEVPPCLDLAVKELKVGAHADVRSVAAFAFGTSAGRLPYNASKSVDPDLVGNDILIKDLELISVDKKDHWHMSDEEKLAECSRLRLSGNAHFKREDYPRALRRYAGADSTISYLLNSPDETVKKKANDALLLLNLNQAQCHLLMKDYTKCTEKCEEALKVDPDNAKAHYRMACAYRERGDLQDARRAIAHALHSDPKNVQLRKEREHVQELIIQEKEKEKKTFGGFMKKIQGFASDDRCTPIATKADESASETGPESN